MYIRNHVAIKIKNIELNWRNNQCDAVVFHEQFFSKNQIQITDNITSLFILTIWVFEQSGLFEHFPRSFDTFSHVYDILRITEISRVYYRVVMWIRCLQSYLSSTQGLLSSCMYLYNGRQLYVIKLLQIYCIKLCMYLCTQICIYYVYSIFIYFIIIIYYLWGEMDFLLYANKIHVVGRKGIFHTLVTSSWLLK